jgi:peptidoglycan/xylan/chitin deacetylase (PgdA/CDA1 family)
LYIFALPGTPGYHEVEFALAGCSGFDTVDMNNLSRIRVGFDYLPGTRGIVYIDSIKMIPNLSSPRVILCFDNGYTNHYEVVRPLLNAHNFKGVFYIITGYLGLPDYMTAEQILQLQAEGHLVGNHTVDHRLWQGQGGMPPLLYWQRVREIVDAAKTLKNIGINEGRRYFCLPSGTSWISNMTPAQKNQALRFLLQYSTHVRMTVDPGYVDGQVAAVCGNYPNPPRNSRLSWALCPSSLDEAKSRIDKAVMDNSLVVFAWHYIMDKPQGDLTADEFSQLLDYIQEKNCQVVTFKDLLQPAIN